MMPVSADNRTMLTPSQAARRWIRADGTPVASVSTLSSWRFNTRTTGKQYGPPCRKIGRLVFYDAAEFDDFMQGY